MKKDEIKNILIKDEHKNINILFTLGGPCFLVNNRCSLFSSSSWGGRCTTVQILMQND